MGTSTSSAGANAGVPFDPPWLDNAGEGIDGSHSDVTLESPLDSESGDSNQPVENNEEEVNTTESDTAESSTTSLAPPGRYGEARRLLTRFVNSGDRSDMGRSVASLVNKGMGGPRRAASRMRTSAAAASALGGFLATVRDGTNPTINQWVASAKARALSAQDAALEVIQQLAPSGGSLDEESAKHAMNQAIIHLYEVDPSTDIFALTDEQISSLMGYTLAFDVYNRVQLELGRVFEKLKYPAQLIHERLAQLQDYILVVVRDGMEKARTSGRVRSVQDISTSALRSALEVFGAT